MDGRRAAFGGLTAELRQAINSPLAGVRGGAVQELAGMLRSEHAEQARAARLALEWLIEDDDRAVAAAAIATLSEAGPTARLSRAHRTVRNPDCRRASRRRAVYLCIAALGPDVRLPPFWSTVLS